MAHSESFQIRIATREDAPALSALAERLFVETFGAANEPENMAAYLPSAFSLELQTAELTDPDRTVRLAVGAGGELIGYAMLRRERRATGVVAERPVELQRIYVDRRWHGQGLGDALLASCVEQARAWGCDALWLGVWQENPRAIAFYQRSGFKIVAEQTFMLGSDRQMDFVMARSLL
jgi:diamine N-acetyltransferase